MDDNESHTRDSNIEPPTTNTGIEVMLSAITDLVRCQREFLDRIKRIEDGLDDLTRRLDELNNNAKPTHRTVNPPVITQRVSHPCQWSEEKFLRRVQSDLKDTEFEPHKD